MDVFRHLLAKVKEAPLHNDPTPYFFVPSAFPEEYYEELLYHLPDTSSYQKLSPSYDKRFILPLTDEEIAALPLSSLFFWKKLQSFLSDDLWMGMLIQKFFPDLLSRFGDNIDKLQLSSVAELLRDFQHYSIGPHTDHPIRAITLLFYFPKDDSKAHLGTSFYRPLEPNFTCEGKVHHKFDGFTKVKTLPYLPNSILGFVKTDKSFHGVEEVLEEDYERNLMNYYLRIRDLS